MLGLSLNFSHRWCRCLSSEDLIGELFFDCIKDYLADLSHANIAQNPLFAVLFQAGVKARSRRLSSPTQNTPSHLNRWIFQSPTSWIKIYS